MTLTDRIPYLAQVDRPKLKLPGGKRLAVWVILNVEEWRIETPYLVLVLSPPPPRWKQAWSLWAMASCRRPKHKLDDQADAIKRAVDIIKFAGKPPRAWESPGPLKPRQRSTCSALTASNMSRTA
ncbi:hypothetical protein BRAS3843_1490008 [Bradyrhizobium sp. STM 3843]|uniref:hypothetical protein n=1 Tax=Bradyrhizobium sp. STM 3843 TaxID=551947 RepID=UPI000240AF6E|nr:hypothetical protein [Bradyrhizobium sp. STM 3843]CCE05840.1 hypothetical protein BRAS3843_1490008 [Bradyrhizobium sp. STM 3843]